MPHLSPPTLTQSEQKAILAATAENIRDHVIYSLALGTGVRLTEIVGLNVGDLFFPDGTPRTRVRIRREIAKGGRAGDVFLPQKLTGKVREFWPQGSPRRSGHRSGLGATLGLAASWGWRASGDVLGADVAERSGLHQLVHHVLAE